MIVLKLNHTVRGGEPEIRLKGMIALRSVSMRDTHEDEAEPELRAMEMIVHAGFN